MARLEDAGNEVDDTRIGVSGEVTSAEEEEARRGTHLTLGAPIRLGAAALPLAWLLPLLALLPALLIRRLQVHPLWIAAALAAAFLLLVAGREIARRRPHSDAASRWIAALEPADLALALLLLALVLVFYRGYERVGSDGADYFAQVRSLAIDHDLDVEGEIRALGARGDARVYPIGTALLWLPFFAACHVLLRLLDLAGAGFATSGFANPYQQAVGLATLTYGSLAIVMVYVLVKRYFEPWISLLGTAGVVLGSFIVWYVAVDGSMSHGASMFTVTLFVYLWHRSRGRKSARRWLLLGAAAGLMTLVRVQNAFFVVLPAIELAADGWVAPSGERRARWLAAGRDGALLAGAGAPLVLLQVWIWHHAGAGWIAVPPAAGPRWTSPTAILDVLFSPNHGLMSWTPVIFLALVGLPLFFARDRRFAAALTLAFTAQLLVNSSLAGWAGGSAFGARRFTECAIVFAIGLASLLAFVERHPRPAIAGALGVLVIVNAAFMLDVRRGALPSGERIGIDAILRSSTSRFGNPFSFPASLLFALRYDVPPEMYERATGRSFNNLAIDLGAVGDDAFLGRGWSTRERDDGGTFRWAIGERSSLIVNLRGEEYLMRLRCAPFGAPGSPRQEVRVRINGDEVGRIELEPEMADYELHVPPGHLEPRYALIELGYRYAISPREAGMSSDARQLAVRFDRIELIRR